jgi:hypothetical protein
MIGMRCVLCVLKALDIGTRGKLAIMLSESDSPNCLEVRQVLAYQR